MISNTLLFQFTLNGINISYILNEPRRERPGFFCICENKDADQLCSYHTADRHLCLRKIESTFLTRNFKHLTIIWAWFVPSLFGNPEDRFSHDEAHNKRK